MLVAQESDSLSLSEIAHEHTGGAAEDGDRIHDGLAVLRDRREITYATARRDTLENAAIRTNEPWA